MNKSKHTPVMSDKKQYTYSWDDSGHWVIITPDLKVFLTWEDFEGSEEKVKLLVNALNDYGDGLIPVNDRMPETEVLLLTSSGIYIIGDWYQGAWRTHRSKWEGNVLVSAFKKEDITHWRYLPNTQQLK